MNGRSEKNGGRNGSPSGEWEEVGRMREEEEKVKRESKSGREEEVN